HQSSSTKQKIVKGHKKKRRVMAKDDDFRNEQTAITLDNGETTDQRQVTTKDVKIMSDSPRKFDRLHLNLNREETVDQRQVTVSAKDEDNTTGNSINQNRRVVEAVTREHNLTPTNIIDDIKMNLVGYAGERLLPLAKACAPLFNIIPDLSIYVQMALDETPEEPPDGLTIDESAAIRLYTIESEGPHQSLYSMLNYTLKTADREDLRPYFKYLKLFLTALAKLPCVPPQTVWRGVTKNLSVNFPPGTLVTWWAFSSCTTTLTVLENNIYLGNTGERTLFSVEAINGRTVQAHSHFVTEDEILLLPGTHMVVQSQFTPAPDLHIIHLKQIIPEEMLLEPPFEDAYLYPKINSSTTRACSNSKDNTNELKQSVMKFFFIDIQAKQLNSWYGKCSICSQNIADKYGTTSNFARHMKTKHGTQYEEWLAKKNANTDTKQRNLHDMIRQKTSKYSSNDPRQVKLTESMLKDLIIECGLPLSLVDQNGFRNFMQTVDPMFSLLSRRQITRDKLPKLHDKMVIKFKKISQHTADILLAEFEKVMNQYHIEKKLVRLITDNAANNIKAFSGIVLPGFETYFEDDDRVDDDNSSLQNNDDFEEGLNHDCFELAPLTYDIIQFLSGNSELLRLPCFALLRFYGYMIVFVPREVSSINPDITFPDKGNKKCLFPTLTAGSFKKAKIDNSTPKSISEEIDGFLQEENLTSNLIFKKASSYRSLNKLAKKIMCVPATSAPIKRIFSQSGLLMRPHRSSFTQANICVLTSLKCNKALI
ncbi:unnamed protein product, partial [Didymodactylos carnosus]